MKMNYKKKTIRQSVNGRTEYTEVLLPYYQYTPVTPIGPWGKRRLSYLQEHHQDLFDEFLENDTLNDHLVDVDLQANELLDRLIEDMKSREGVTEELKARDQLAWVQAMQNIRLRAEEMVWTEVIFN